MFACLCDLTEAQLQVIGVVAAIIFFIVMMTVSHVWSRCQGHHDPRDATGKRTIKIFAFLPVRTCCESRWWKTVSVLQWHDDHYDNYGWYNKEFVDE